MRKAPDLTRRSALAAAVSTIALPAFAQPPTLKTPGVYIAEPNAFPNSIVGVDTSVVAFVGPATPPGKHGNRFGSFAEYVDLFGEEAPAVFALHGEELRDVGSHAMMERSVRWFYQNGGESAYVLDAGTPNETLTLDAMLDALARAALVNDVSLLVAPDAIRLSPKDCITFQHAMLAQCAELGDRFAILDVHPGLGARGSPLNAAVAFGEAIGTRGADYGAAYFPTIETSIAQRSHFSFMQFEDLGALAEVLMRQDTAAGLDLRKTRKVYNDIATFDVQSARDGDKGALELQAELDRALAEVSPAFKAMQAKMAQLRNHLPVSPAIAGIYALTDATQGVWQAPANRSLISVIAPSVLLDSQDIAALNNPGSGPPVNAIRTFIGEGAMVWGARTLDTSDPDSRYVSAKRTMIFLKSSIGAAVQSYTFSPNVANTWATVRSMITSFLTAQWQQGALAGNQPDEAFAVQCGLGVTMTEQDILSGRMRVTVMVAIARPAEFQVIEFEVAMDAP